MSREVNPFEPWRPPGYQPPDPPREEDPIPPSRARAQTIGSTVVQKALLGLWGVLIVAGVVLLATLPWEHFPRVGAVVLATGLGLTFAILLLLRRRWWIALGCAAVGVLVAVGAWWLTPTAGGPSLWSAHQEAARYQADLGRLPAGDLDAFLKEKAERRELLRLFPRFAPEVGAAEREWLTRAAEALEANLRAVPAGDMAGFRKEERQRRQLTGPFTVKMRGAEEDWARRSAEAVAAEIKTLAPAGRDGLMRVRAAYRLWLRDERLHHLASQPPQIDEAERDWAVRAATAAKTEADALRAGDPAKASARLREAWDDLAALELLEPVREQLRAARRQAAAARLEAARRETMALLVADRFVAVGELGEKVARELADEADLVGLRVEVEAFRNSCGVFGDLARQAGKRQP